MAGVREALTMAHRGGLIVESESMAMIRFRHADGRGYGDVPEPGPLDVVAKGSDYRHLGFRDTEFRAVLSELSTGGKALRRVRVGYSARR
jgi:hypothetical protein